MARNLSVLEVLLIIFLLIVLAVDVFLMFLVFENTSGKSDVCGCLVGKTGKESPPLDAKEIVSFLHSSPVLFNEQRFGTDISS